MIKYLTVFVLVSLNALLLNAQTKSQLSAAVTALENNEYSGNSGDLLFVCRADQSPVVQAQNDWKESVLVDYKNNTHKVKGRYNAEKDELQILLNGKPKTVFPQKIKAAKIGKMIVVPSDFQNDGFVSYGYFALLSEGNVSLLKRFEIEKGQIRKKYYSLKENEIAKPLHLKKKAVLKLLDSQDAKKYLQDNVLDVSKEDDLKALFQFYNGFK